MSDERPPGPGSDHAAVARANEAFYAAFERLDLEEMERVWSSDPTISCIHPGWAPLIGRARVMASWAGILHGTRAIRFTLHDPRVVVRGDTGWVIAIEEIEADQGDAHVRGFALSTNVFCREAQAWRLVHHHASPTPDPGRGPASEPGGHTLH